MLSLSYPNVLKEDRQFILDDDFEGMPGSPLADAVPHRIWTGSTAVDGTILMKDAANGVLEIITAVSSIGDNEDIAFHTRNELFKFAFDKPSWWGARIKFAQGATNVANLYVGFMDAFATDPLQANGLGLKTTFSGMGFYCIDGFDKWRFGSSVGNGRGTARTPSTIPAADTYAAGSTEWQFLECSYRPLTSALAEVIFTLTVGNTSPVVVAVHELTYTSATEMNFGIYMRNGATSAESILVDRLTAVQLR